ncbi:hypothetical protein SCP_0400220 [Sparassis crispa]|uniref:Uncharacterized protein n=1 Tax=Sparassis crispa TaxID=139825 RepID=A0A401GHQ4_9APHY|nr:hypothetical protein SCP_0400220 [Sparassis crispa]GBE81651.1 hypothetical protein SCP_0400220 [Sparassis crispa]
MWRFTSYPSEPYLSSVAAHLLHKTPGALTTVLACLEGKLDSGMIAVGQSGELVSRLLWLLGKDLFATQSFDETTTRNQELLYCRSIPVLPFLEFFFGMKFWPADDEQKTAAREAFKNARINFSHWVAMSDNISKEGVKWNPREWILRHWYRTCAIQCCHGQPRTDKMIPMYFDDFSGRNDQDRMSSIFISDKAGENDSPRDVNFIDRTHDSINCSTSRPYIAITLDLGVQDESITSTFPTSTSERVNAGVDNRCLRIYARGMSAETYPFLNKVEGLFQVMKQVAVRERAPLYPSPIEARLQDLFKYGSTSSERHMKWEAGRDPRLLFSTE